MNRQGGRALKTKLTIAMVAAVLVAGMGQFNSAQAQQQSGIVAVLDVAKVFNENVRFNAQMDAIKAEMDRSKGEIQAKQAKIQEDAKAVLAYEVGTQQRNLKEAEIEQRQAALRTEARQKDVDLMTREARIYFETYRQMKSVVAEIAERNSISLVLRFDSSPINPDNRAEIIKGVNRLVVFNDRLDLTTMVLEGMQASTAAAPNGIQRK